MRVQGPDTSCSVMIWVSSRVDAQGVVSSSGCVLWEACFTHDYPEALRDKSKLIVSLEGKNDSQEIGPQVS